MVDTTRLVHWYQKHGRHELPWRLTRDPYSVLVSEVMLQQTQVARVIPYWHDWMTRWPTVRHAAGAPLADAIGAWSGLGYNRRAVNLIRAAGTVIDEFAGEVPLSVQDLERLPGVGSYTARAVACFAAGAAVPVLDTNIKRVIARGVLGLDQARDATPSQLEAAADKLVPTSGARAFNLALMDLGSSVCTARSPLCQACPVAAGCTWVARGRPTGPERPRDTTPFAATSRFARGRIVAELRDGFRTSADLASAVGPAHEGALHRYLAALVNDGLIVARPGGWSLPAHSMSIASPKLKKR